VLDFFASVLAPYALRAVFSHLLRLVLFLYFLHIFRALASFSALVWTFGFTTAGGDGGARLPGPENVALDGGP